MSPTNFLIGLLAVVSVAASLAMAALLSAAQRPPPALPAVAAAPAAGEPDRATILARVTALQERLEREPDDFDGWSMLGRSLVGLGRYAEAVGAYSHAAELRPSDPGVRAALRQLDEVARERGAHDTGARGGADDGAATRTAPPAGAK